MTEEEKKEFEEFLEWKKQKKEAEQKKAKQQKVEQQKAEQSTSSTLSVSIPQKASEDKKEVVENSSNSQLDDKATKNVIRVCLAILVIAIILIFANIKCSNQTSTANRINTDSLYDDTTTVDTTTELEEVPSYDESVDDEYSYRPTVEVKNSAWDGSVKQVEDYLQATLRDPDSYESIEWSEVKRKDDGYYVRHKYRAKNGFGGYVVANQGTSDELCHLA